LDSAHQILAAELFFKTAAPALVREVAGTLASAQIPVMPLKGVLLQQLVYRTSFRAMSDVDLLVPPSLFVRAREILRRAGFQVFGVGQDVLRRSGFILEIDLHRKLSTTTRSRLLPEDMFRRGRTDVELFGVSVVIPDGRDLFAHLLLHLTLHWITHGVLHHPEDLEAVSEALALSVPSLASHLRAVGLEPHAQLMLPLVEEQRPGRFTRSLRATLVPAPRLLARAEIARAIAARSAPGSFGRRLGGALLSPSLSEAFREAILARIYSRQRSSD